MKMVSGDKQIGLNWVKNQKKQKNEIDSKMKETK